MAFPRIRHVLLALLVLAPAARAAGDEPAPPAERLRATEAGYARALVELAASCPDLKLWGERDRIAARVLLVEPDQPKARAWLKYARGAGGAWTRPASWKPAQNVANAAALPDLRRREAALEDDHATEVLAIVGGGGLSIAEEERALDRLAALAPDAERARAAHREERSADRWVLAESAVARDRTARLAREAREAVEAVPPPASVEAAADDLVLLPSPSGVLRAGTLRAVVGGSLDEATKALRLGAAAVTVFRRAFDLEAPPALAFTYVLYATREDGLRALRTAPGLEAADREFAAGLDAYWIDDGRRVLVYSDPSNVLTRIEWGPRLVAEHLLERRCGLSRKQGFLFEGLSLFLTWRTSGTHRTFAADRAAYADPKQAGVAERLAALDADWMAEARALRAKGTAPDLRIALGKDVNALTPVDRLFAFAFAAYLLEGRPSDAFRIVGAFRDDAPMDAALANAVRATPEGLEARFVRWLEETAPAR